MSTRRCDLCPVLYWASALHAIAPPDCQGWGLESLKLYCLFFFSIFTYHRDPGLDSAPPGDHLGPALVAGVWGL